MKTTFKFIIAAMAAVSVFSSCQKELANETVNNTTGGVRTIAVQFDNSTKATLDGFTPKFANGDAIRVSNTEKSEECTVTVSEATATFTTTLSGALTAIYPADAAVYTSGTPDGPISSPYFKVSASQDGTMEKAIIAKATVAEGESTATFYGLTSLFVVTPPSGATSFTITSLNKIGTDGQRSGTAVAINTSGADDAAKRIITVTGVDTDGNAYVSLVPGVNLTDLSFEYTTDDTHGAMKGIPMKDITKGGNTDATAANTKYTIGNSNWHPYVKIGGKKWATMNIGAASSTDAGLYFMWGETNGIVPSGSTFTFPASKYYTNADNSSSSWDKTKGFGWENCPWTDGVFNSSSNKNVFTKYTASNNDYAKSGTADGKTTLELADDAAYANWGGPWRMPTGGTGIELGSGVTPDFTALAKAAKSDYSSSGFSPTLTGDVPTLQGVYYYNVDGGKGLYFVDSSGNKLFFPAAGYGGGTNFSGADHGNYWSSTLKSSIPDNAYYLTFSSGNVKPQGYNWRYYGFSVRPVSDQ